MMDNQTDSQQDELYCPGSICATMAQVLVFSQKWVPLLIIAFGLVGNMLLVAITNKEENRRISTCVYMTALGVEDTVYLMVFLIHTILWQHEVLVWDLSKEHRDMVFSVIIFLLFEFSKSSKLTLAAMTVDRAYVVLHPLAAKTVCNPSKAKKVIIAITILLAAWNSYFFVPNYNSSTWKDVLIKSLEVIFATILPFTVVFVSNILIALELKLAAKRRTGMTDGAKSGKEVQLTRMLMLISAAFVICISPLAVYDLLQASPYINAMYDMRNPYWALRFYLENWYMVQFNNLNHACNFYIYVLGGGKNHRNDVKNIFRCLRRS
ncbi:mu-type opioid receptor-like [Lineus longissimus]|uniref:mu-type opioid receptor-like n=1 Tax=Lineus longissimus TaxID=88925 RepID=UPI00315D5BA9